MRKFSELKDREKVALCLLSVTTVALLLRAPFFYQGVINWDESTWLVYGAMLLDGYPLRDIPESNTSAVLWVYALFAKIGGGVALPRVVGFVLASASAVLVFLSYRRIDESSRWAGPLFSALFFVLLSSDLKWDGVVLMKEVLTLPFLCFAVFFLASPQRGWFSCFIAGCCLAVSVLVFPAALFFALAVFAFFLFLDFREHSRVVNISTLVAGGVFCTALFLSFGDNFEYTLRLAEVLSTGVYGRQSSTLLDSFLFVRHLFTSGNAFVLFLVFLSPFLLRGTWLMRCLFLVVCFFAAFVLMGKTYSHHMISISPMLALVAGMSAAVLWRRSSASKSLVVAAVLWGVAVQIGYHGYYKAQVLNYNSRRDFPYSAAQYLNSRGVEGKYVYFTEAQLGYLLTDAKIPTKYIHPSIVFNPRFQRIWENNNNISPTTELENIFSRRPVFVVTARDPKHANDTQAQFLYGKLLADYKVVRVIPDLYKRRKDDRRDLLIHERKGTY